MAKAKEQFKVQPMNDRVIVRHIDEDVKTTAGGIIIPDSAKERPQLGEVVAVGPGRRDNDGKRIELDVHIGQRVYHSKYGGTEVKIDGEDFLILREEDILAIIQD